MRTGSLRWLVVGLMSILLISSTTPIFGQTRAFRSNASYLTPLKLSVDVPGADGNIRSMEISMILKIDSRIQIVDSELISDSLGVDIKAVSSLGVDSSDISVEIGEIDRLLSQFSTMSDIPIRATDTAEVALAVAAPVLLAPSDGAHFSSSRVTFEWTWDGALQDNWGFEILGWKPGGKHYGIHDAKETVGITPNSDGKYSLTVTLPHHLRTGDWQWSVVPVQLEPYTRIGPEANPRGIILGSVDTRSGSHGVSPLPTP